MGRQQKKPKHPDEVSHGAKSRGALHGMRGSKWQEAFNMEHFFITREACEDVQP